MRSTGKLHLGNYVGALQNWVRMQDEYECFFMVADWHALTTDYADTSRIKENSLEVVLDWLAAGLDPEKSVIFIQSHVPAHAELHLLFSMITPLGWLERVPTYKEQRENIKDKDLGTYGFLGYPVLQAADILVYKADCVPVGEDQVAHVELTREIARRFNGFYGHEGRRGFPGADRPCSTPAAKLPGTDGRKMSKSYGNTVLLTDPEPVVRQKLKTMVTDPARVRRSDTGESRCVSGGRFAQNLQRQRNHGQGERRLPVGWDWLHRVQRLGCRRAGEAAEPDAGAAQEIRGESAAGVGYSGSWHRTGPQGGGRDDGRCEGGDGNVAGV